MEQLINSDLNSTFFIDETLKKKSNHIIKKFHLFNSPFRETPTTSENYLMSPNKGKEQSGKEHTGYLLLKL